MFHLPYMCRRFFKAGFSCLKFWDILTKISAINVCIFQFKNKSLRKLKKVVATLKKKFSLAINIKNFVLEQLHTHMYFYSVHHYAVNRRHMYIYLKSNPFVNLILLTSLEKIINLPMQCIVCYFISPTALQNTLLINFIISYI